MEAAALFVAAAALFGVVVRNSEPEKEAFESAVPRGTAADPLTQAARGASVTGPPQQIDLMYQNLMSRAKSRHTRNSNELCAPADSNGSDDAQPSTTPRTD